MEGKQAKGLESNETLVKVVESNEKIVKEKKRGSSKLLKERTEPLWGYSFFIQEEKQKAGKSKLEMKSVNAKWASMDESLKEPYNELSRKDKLSLGPNYRKREKKDLMKTKKEKKKIKKKVVESESRVKVPKKLEPTICSLLQVVRDLDMEIGSKLSERLRQDQTFLKLKIEAEIKVKEIADTDSSIHYYSNKCHVLMKKKAAKLE
jgi:hypothetical protein